MKLNSSKPSGDFLKFEHVIYDNLYLYKVIPETADHSIPVNLSFVKCIDFVKKQNSTDVSIYLYSDSNNIPEQDGYSLKPLPDGISIDTDKTPQPYILSNVNGHFFIPLSSQKLLDDLVEFTRNMMGYVGIRVILYNYPHHLSSLVNRTQSKLERIRKPVEKKVTVGSGENAVTEIKLVDHLEKGSELDVYGDELVAKMREYTATKIYSVYLFLNSKEDYEFVRGHTFESTMLMLDTLKFMPVKPLKRRIGILKLKKEKLDPLETISKPLFFDVTKAISRCTSEGIFTDSYFSDKFYSRRKNSPVICVRFTLTFPFTHPLIAKTVPSREIADKVNNDTLLDEEFGENNFSKPVKDDDDVIDSDFFDDNSTSTIPSSN